MKHKQSPLDEIEIRLALADRISRVAIHESSAGDIAQRTLAELPEAVPIDWASLVLIDRETQRGRLIVLVGKGKAVEENDFPLGGTPYQWVVMKKQALLEPDLSQGSRFSVVVPANGVRTAVHMPLIYQGEVFGVLTVGSCLPSAYGESDLRLLRYAVSQLSVSLKGALLLEQNLEMQASLSNLRELLSIISSSPELPETFPLFGLELKKNCPFDRLSLAYVEGNVLRILSVVDGENSNPKAGETCLLADSAIPWMQEHGEINIEEDFDAERRFPIDELHFNEGFRGEIRVPLFSHGELFASLHLVSREPCRLKDELAFLAQLGNYLATPVSSYLLYSRERQRHDWLSALAHNLATPLTAIVSSSQLLAEELEAGRTGRCAKLARNIYAGGQAMTNNLKAFRDFSEVESAYLQLNLEAVDIKPVLDQAVEETLVSAGARSQVLEAELPNSLPRVHADASRVKQILHILLDNSVRASPRKGRIRLRVAAEEGKLVLEVLDSATTCSAQDRESLLQPYRLGEADRVVSPELSLRISTCRRLVELHGGSFWLKVGPEEVGNIFGFSLLLEDTQAGTTDG